eukprot:COSAG01_NODE_283_length_19477_cov_44.267468_17_plen_76_part_00
MRILEGAPMDGSEVRDRMKDRVASHAEYGCHKPQHRHRRGGPCLCLAVTLSAFSQLLVCVTSDAPSNYNSLKATT